MIALHEIRRRHEYHQLAHRRKDRELPADGEFVGTHNQIDEINRTSDEDRRARLVLTLTTTIRELVPTESAVWDVSRLDWCKLGDGIVYNRLLPRPLPRAAREPASALSSSLPSSSGKILGTRTELVKADAHFVEEHTNWLLQRTAQTNAAADLVDARLRFAEKLSHLATVPALMNTSDPHPTPASFSLTLAEIEQMIAGMPKVSPELRGALLRLLQARLKEKLQ